MKITDIKTYPIWVGTRNQLVVKVETDEGIAGWGESGLSGREQAVVGAIRHYREWLIGHPITQALIMMQSLHSLAVARAEVRAGAREL